RRSVCFVTDDPSGKCRSRALARRVRSKPRASDATAIRSYAGATSHHPGDKPVALRVYSARKRTLFVSLEVVRACFMRERQGTALAVPQIAPFDPGLAPEGALRG